MNLHNLSVLDNSYITKNTEWSGEIFIKGVVVIKKDVELKIHQGTIIKFVKIDLNNDNVGDSELIIEGRLIAQGTKDKPIIFTSAEKTPAIKDWTYVYIERNQNFIVENCCFSYAFTGLQIHYSNGIIKNNLFENNFEGLRYSTVNISIQNNTFKNNNYGIRFESRYSDAEILNNEITDNDYGIFAVMRSLEKENKITNNNIYENRKYNFLMGIEQPEDLNVSSNWWGTIDEHKIGELIYDKNDDMVLGRIKYAPFLKSKVENAGR